LFPLRGLEIRKEVSALRRYETIFILRPDLGKTVQKESIRRFENIVRASGGETIETDEWGFRELAYHIKGERRGFYVRLDYGGNGATMNEIERNLRLSDSVLRYLSVLVDTDIEPATVRAELEAHRRRSAEARAAAEAARAAAELARTSTPEKPLDESQPGAEEALGGSEFEQIEASEAADSESTEGEGEEQT
jgi:small subunit ribosomal protein S6